MALPATAISAGNGILLSGAHTVHSSPQLVTSSSPEFVLSSPATVASSERHALISVYSPPISVKSSSSSNAASNDAEAIIREGHLQEVREALAKVGLPSQDLRLNKLTLHVAATLFKGLSRTKRLLSLSLGRRREAILTLLVWTHSAKCL